MVLLDRYRSFDMFVSALSSKFGFLCLRTRCFRTIARIFRVGIRKMWVELFDELMCLFFFQAEDGIRDIGVTGVQTCALPICEQELGAELMRELERFLLLQIIDTQWREHLYDMDYLREGIHLRGFAQIDPLVAYKNEAYDLFTELMTGIWTRFAQMIFNVDVEIEGGNGDGGAAAVPPPRSATGSSTGRSRVTYTGGAGGSAEHTAELQSSQYLACRLLLAKNTTTSLPSCNSRFCLGSCNYV